MPQQRSHDHKPDHERQYGEHTFGLHLGEAQDREHRDKVVSTIVLAVIFVALLATYAYLHGSTRFELFQPHPTTSTVEPIPIIPWDEYQKQREQQMSTQSTSPSSTTSSPTSSTELTTEPSPEESVETEQTDRRRLFPPFKSTGEDAPSSSPPTSEPPATR